MLRRLRLGKGSQSFEVFLVKGSRFGIFEDNYAFKQLSVMAPF